MAVDLFRLLMSFLPVLVSSDSSEKNLPQNKSNQPNNPLPKKSPPNEPSEKYKLIFYLSGKTKLRISVIRSVTPVTCSFRPLPKKYILPPVKFKEEVRAEQKCLKKPHIDSFASVCLYTDLSVPICVHTHEHT